MKKSEWNEGLNYIDSDLVEKYVMQKESYAKKRRTRGIWLRACAIAACLAIVICSLTLAPMLFNGDNSIDGTNSDNGFDGGGMNGEMDGGNSNTIGKVTNEYNCETYTSVIPVDDLDFEGDTITVLHRDSVSFQREWYKKIPEDNLDEVISMRNEMVSESLNMKVRYEAISGSNYADCLNGFTAAIKEDVDYDFHKYDVVANHAYASASAFIRDYISNLADKDVFPYFELSLPCWNQSLVNDSLINDQLYYITGDLNLSTFDKTMVVFLNKKMYNEKKSADDPNDLQSLALEGYDAKNKIGKAGGFTYDDLYRWATVWEDNNGTSGNQHDDFHAISAPYGSMPIDALPFAWELDYIRYNQDGTHKYNIVGNTKIQEAVVKAQKLFNSALNDGVSNANNGGECSLGDCSEPIAHFAADKSIFAFGLLYGSEADNAAIREMSSEYGLLPMPKYNADQERYVTTADSDYTLITVINHVNSSVPTKVEMVSAYLQYSAEESYTNIRSYYIDSVIAPKGKESSSTEMSVAIFNIIADNIELPFAYVYAPQLNYVLNNCWRDVVTDSHISGATTAKDAYEAESDKYDAALENIDTWLGLN